MHETRKRMADKYLAGQGVEIGALHQPLPLPPQATVRYVDRSPLANLKQHYPELGDNLVIEPDVLDDGETLQSFGDQTQDFLIANHFIEHCENPIGALNNHLRVLRPGGVLYMAVPDKRHTFDANRPLTPLEHVVADYDGDCTRDRRAHYEEWARMVEGAGDVAARTDQLMAMRYSIHFHVWTAYTFLVLLGHCHDQLGLPFEWEHFEMNGIEFITILRRV